MSTTIAVEPDALDSLAADYGNVELGLRYAARQATVPLQLVPRDPQIGPARLEDRLAAISAVLRSTSDDVEARKRDLTLFAEGARVIDAGRVALGSLVAAPTIAADALRRFEAGAWHAATHVADDLEQVVERQVATEFQSVRRAFDGVGQVAVTSANTLVHAVVGLGRLELSGLDQAGDWLGHQATGLAHGFEHAWHDVTGFLSGTDRRLQQLEKTIAGLWTKYQARIARDFEQLPGVAWEHIKGTAVGTRITSALNALTAAKTAVEWVWDHRQQILQIVERVGGHIPMPPRVPGAEVVKKESVSVEAKVPWDGVTLGAGLSVELDTYDKNGGVDLRIDAKAFAEVGIDDAKLKALGLDASVRGTLTGGATWHFANRTDAMAFAARLALLADLAELRATQPMLAGGVIDLIRRTDPNVLDVPKPLETRAGVSLTGDIGIKGGPKLSGTVAENLTLDDKGAAALTVSGSITFSDPALSARLRSAGIAAPDSVTGTLAVTGHTADGKVQVTASGEFDYDGEGKEAGLLGVDGTSSHGEKVEMSRTFTLDPQAALALAGNPSQQKALLHQAFSASDTHVEVWSKAGTDISAADDLVKVSSDVENRVATGTLDQLPQFLGQAAKV